MVERDPNDDKDVIVEIQGGAGGEEAGLWAGDLYRMLTKYAERRGFKAEPLERRRRQVHLRDQGRRRLLGLQVRGRHAPRAARARHRVAGPHPHLDRHGRGAARGRGRRRPGRPERPADRRLPLVGPGRAVGQHDRLGGAHHAQAVGHRRLDAGREEPAAEPREGDARAARAPVRAGARRAAGRAGRRPPLAGRHRRPRGEDPHLQLRRAPRHRPPHQAHRRTTSTQVLEGELDEFTAALERRREAPRPRGPGGRRRWRRRPACRSRDALDCASIAIAAAGVDTPRLDAELLLAHALRRRPRGAAHGRPSAPVDGPGGARLPGRSCAAARSAASRSPTSSAAKGFRHLELHVDPRVLVPRPETETLVEAALDAAARRARGRRRDGQRRRRARAQGRAPRPRRDRHRRQRGGARRRARQRRAAGARRRASRSADLLAGVGRGRRGRLQPALRRRGRPRALPPEVARHEPAARALRRARRPGRHAAAGRAGRRARRRLLALEVGAGQAPARSRSWLRAAGFARVERARRPRRHRARGRWRAWR